MKTTEDLIERLESIRSGLQSRKLTLGEYEAIGWADRPLKELIDTARAEADLQTRAVLPGSPIGPLLRPIRKCGP